MIPDTHTLWPANDICHSLLHKSSTETSFSSSGLEESLEHVTAVTNIHGVSQSWPSVEYYERADLGPIRYGMLPTGQIAPH